MHEADSEQEKREGIIRISESSDIMQSVLHFCYSGTYEAPADQGIPTANQSVTAEKSLGQQSFHHAQVYEIAVKYGFPSLLDFVVNQWKKDIKSFMQYSPTKGAPLPRLRPGLWSSDAARHEDLKILLDAIFHIYEHEDGVWHHDRIRLLLTEIPWGYKLVFDNKSIWMDFFERTPGYAVDLVARLSLRVTELEDEFKTTKHYECGLCGSIQLMDTHCDAEEDEGYCFYCGEKQSGWHSKEEKDMPTSIQTRLKRYLE